MSDKRTCPVCGHTELEEPPYDEFGNPSYVICSCCGFEFGFDDASEGYTFEQYRREWIENGFDFFSEPAPENWSEDVMRRQLENAKGTSWEPRLPAL
jgi:hypothetical protein